MIWGRADVMIIEIKIHNKYNLLESSPHHPFWTPSSHPSLSVCGKICLPQNCFLVLKRLGTTSVNYLILTFIDIYENVPIACISISHIYHKIWWSCIKSKRKYLFKMSDCFSHNTWWKKKSTSIWSLTWNTLMCYH